MTKYTASDIAKWFLNYNNIMIEKYEADAITNLKLQNFFIMPMAAILL